MKETFIEHLQLTASVILICAEITQRCGFYLRMLLRKFFVLGQCYITMTQVELWKK